MGTRFWGARGSRVREGTKRGMTLVVNSASRIASSIPTPSDTSSLTRPVKSDSTASRPAIRVKQEYRENRPALRMRKTGVRVQLSHVPYMHLGCEGRMVGSLEILRSDADELIHLIDCAIEKHVVISHIEMAVVVDPLRIDMHQRRDERREEHRIEISTVEHGVKPRSDKLPCHR